MKEVFDELLHSIGAYLPNLLGALAILVVGWLVAFLIAALVRAILRRITLDNKLAKTVFGRDDPRGMPIEDAVARSVLLVIGVFVLLAFFEALRLTAIAEPIKTLLNSVFAYLPRILGALVLVLLAWLVATVLRRVMLAVMDRTKLDEHISGEVKGAGKPLALGKTLAEVVYWLTFLLFLPGILDALALQGPLEPVKALLNRVSEFMPNVLGAALIVIIGWFIARLVQRVVGNLLAAAGTDRVGERLGVAEALGERKLSGVIALVAYVLILIPVLIAALNALKLDAVTQPASQMLGTILDAIPAVFGAVVILVIAYAVARVVSTLASSLLAGVGFDNVLARLGITKARLEGAAAPSAIVGLVVMVAIMVFASIEAARMLKFDMFADMLRQVVEFGAHVLLGLVIFALGMFLANIVAKAVSESDTPRASVLANTARIAILVLAGAMALRQMNVANDIIQLAFGLILGAVAIAVALAFGLGGRDSAARLIEEWRHGTKGK